MSSLALLNVRQEKGETLAGIHGKIHQAIFRHLKYHARNSHLISTLKPRQFTDSLINKPSKNLDELRNRATKFMKIEELRDFHKNVRANKGRDRGKEKDRLVDKFRDNRGPCSILIPH